MRTLLLLAIFATSILNFGCAASHNAAENVIAQGKLDDAKGKANPVAHPTDAVNVAVKKLTGFMLVVNIASFVALIVGVGLLFTSLSSLSKIITPIAGAGVCLSFAGIVVIPFMPWIIYALLAAGIGFGIYELVKNRKTVAADIEAEFTKPAAKAVTSPGVPTPAVSPTNAAGATADPLLMKLVNGVASKL